MHLRDICPVCDHQFAEHGFTMHKSVLAWHVRLGNSGVLPSYYGCLCSTSVTNFKIDGYANNRCHCYYLIDPYNTGTLKVYHAV